VSGKVISLQKSCAVKSARALKNCGLPSGCPEIFPKHQRGLTILELLVCVGIVTLLLSLLLPALGAVRESARRMQCNNNLKQIGLALHQYHDVNAALPPGWRWDRGHLTAFGWLPPLLGYLDESALAARLDGSEPVNSSLLDEIRQVTLPVFLCPSDMVQPTFLLYAEPDGSEWPADAPLMRLPAASYLGVFGVQEPDDVWRSQLGTGAFAGSRPIRFADFSRGLSHVLLVGERRASTIPSTWLGIDARGEDAHCRILGNAHLGPNVPYADECEFTSRHPHVANFLWADGHVKAVANAIDQRVYQQMAHRGNSEE